MSASSTNNPAVVNLVAANGLTGEKVALSKLQPRLCAMVVSIDADGEDTDRLKAMGLCVGDSGHQPL